MFSSLSFVFALVNLCVGSFIALNRISFSSLYKFDSGVDDEEERDVRFTEKTEGSLLSLSTKAENVHFLVR